jgi:transcriptional regulator
MYAPEHFAETDVARLHALMRERSFATLVSLLDGELFATHVPLLLDTARGPHGTLVGHVARANPHARAFDGRTPALAIFHGPHAYVSPRWFVSPRNVPTWNYVAVHASGTPHPIEDAALVHDVVARTAAVYEGGAKEPWTPDAAPAPFIAGLQRAIVAFELPIARLTGKWKLSQNKSAEDRAGVVAGLRAEAAGGAEANAAAAVAALMETLA